MLADEVTMSGTHPAGSQAVLKLLHEVGSSVQHISSVSGVVVRVVVVVGLH